ncbi:GDP-mannose 4,6-dehydratase [Patescibacteria group bacterium]|nr:GDP-mannose 4,6-dehydratase [Patescibacteria group bacterium]MCL5798016.1 GDP-mannose 4,6-dehydratase [Patescibacteria group bacterium]
MKILVTGGAGFIASHIVDAFIAKGYEVCVVDNLSTGHRDFVNKNAVFYEADIRDRKAIEKIFQREKPDIIDHHAAQISVRNSVDDPINDAQVNLLGLLNLLETGRKTGIKKVIFASSGGVVYGEAKKVPTPESYKPLQPLSPYGVSKLASEYYLHFYHKTYGIPFVALRYSNVYGPRQNPHGEAGVVAIFSLKLLYGQVPVINGDGRQTRDYVYVADVVKANVLAAKKSVVGAFNIGTGKETDVVKIYEKIRKSTDSQIVAKHGPAKDGEQKRSCLDASMADEKLGWEPQVDLSKGLDLTVAYFKNLRQ